MRLLYSLLLAGLCAMNLMGCGPAERPQVITDRNIPTAEVTEFYYTYETINYGAFYQRYRFSAEDGRHLFFHETRERPEDYGPTTEADVTAAGTCELTSAQWQEVMALLKNGRVSRREDAAESGASGPWTYIYWEHDGGEYQRFDFSDYGELSAFEEYCAALAQKNVLPRS